MGLQKVTVKSFVPYGLFNKVAANVAAIIPASIPATIAVTSTEGLGCEGREGYLKILTNDRQCDTVIICKLSGMMKRTVSLF